MEEPGVFCNVSSIIPHLPEKESKEVRDWTPKSCDEKENTGEKDTGEIIDFFFCKYFI